MSVAAALVLCGDRSRLEVLTRSISVRVGGLAKEARIVLLAAEGLLNAGIAADLDQPKTVVGWRGRYEAGGSRGLEDHAAGDRGRSMRLRRVETLKFSTDPDESTSGTRH